MIELIIGVIIGVILALAGLYFLQKSGMRDIF
jgi:uncharacterized membrane protein YccC